MAEEIVDAQMPISRCRLVYTSACERERAQEGAR